MRALLAALLTVLLSTAANADPAMWEASDGDSRVVLFGSVHMLPPHLDWRTPALDAAMTKSEQVYFETDVGPRGLIALTVKMTVAMFQASGTPWLHLLTDDQLDLLARALEPLGMTLEAAAVTPPWLLTMQLANQQMTGAETSDYSFEGGVEWTLQWDLVPDRKAYFETPGEQYDMLAAGTLEEQVQGLVAALNETAGSEALADLVSAWASGDVDALQQVMVPKNEAEQAAMEALLYERNRKWIPQIERLLADNREDLIVVGAAHLAGAGSVLDLLEKAGYTVTRIQ